MRTRDDPQSLKPIVVDTPRLLRPSDEQLRRWSVDRKIFISSVMSMSDERRAVIDGIDETGAIPMAWERLTPRPVAPEDAWLDGVRTSHALALLVGREYGRRRIDGYSATHREFLLAEELGLLRWVFVDATVNPEDRDGHLQAWLSELSDSYSYSTFTSIAELRASVTRTISTLASYRLYSWFKLGDLVLRAADYSLTLPGGWSGEAGTLEISGSVSDARIRARLARVHQGLRSLPLVIDGQLFDASPASFVEHGEWGSWTYDASYRLRTSQRESALLGMTLSESGRTWQPAELAELAIRDVLGLPVGERPQMLLSPAPAVEWADLLAVANNMPDLLNVLAGLVISERLVRSGALGRVTHCEARLAGMPRAIVAAVEGETVGEWGQAPRTLRVTGRVVSW